MYDRPSHSNLFTSFKSREPFPPVLERLLLERYTRNGALLRHRSPAGRGDFRSRRPGRRGIGIVRTTFVDGRIDEFEVEFLGISADSGAAGIDLILGRATGAVVDALGGVPPGTSGSPVYVDGELIGAVGYVLSDSFRIVGITPIAAMNALRGEPLGDPYRSGEKRGSFQEGGEALSARSTTIARALRGSPGGPKALESPELRGVSVAPGRGGWFVHPTIAAAMSHGAKQQVAVGGFRAPLALAALENVLGESLSGWASVSGTPQSALCEGPQRALRGRLDDTPQAVAGVESGSAIGFALLTGDVRAGFLGTATTVRGKELLAFGHPVLFTGTSCAPLVSARIYTTEPGRPPQKVADLGEWIGRVVQDRSAGILAILGEQPEMVQMTMRVKDDDRGRTELLKADAVDDASLLAPLAYSVAYEAVVRVMNRVGPGTAAWVWHIGTRAQGCVRESFQVTKSVDVAGEIAESIAGLLDQVHQRGVAVNEIELEAEVRSVR